MNILRDITKIKVYTIGLEILVLQSKNFLSLIWVMKKIFK